MEPAIAVLVVEDNPGDVRLVAEYLAGSHLGRFVVHAVRRLGDAMAACSSPSPPDVVLLDLELPDATGWEAVRALRAAAPGLPIVVATGSEDPGVGCGAMTAGADDFLFKSQLGVGVVDRALWYAVERRRVYRQLEQTHRLASMGRLAAGLAHEINNPASYVIGNLELLQDALVVRAGEPVETDDVGGMIDDCLEGIRRIRGIVRELQAFARVDSQSLEDVDVAAAVRSACDVVRNAVQMRARLELDLPALPPVRADRCKLAQAFLNLILNAADAVDVGGVITVKAWVGGGELVVDVIDSGCGIRDEDREKIFEPFFTTKPAGHGIGLGLSLANEVVRRHGGRITLDSAPGQGSRFSVRLPLGR